MVTSGFGQASLCGPESCPLRTHLSTEGVPPEQVYASQAEHVPTIGEQRTLPQATVAKLLDLLGKVAWSTQPRP